MAGELRTSTARHRLIRHETKNANDDDQRLTVDQNVVFFHAFDDSTGAQTRPTPRICIGRTERPCPVLLLEALLQWMAVSGGVWICSLIWASRTGCYCPEMWGFGLRGPDNVFDLVRPKTSCRWMETFLGA